MLPVPPPTYAGTERVVAALGDELHRRGHHVALVAPGDSKVPYEHIPTIDESLWSAGYSGRLEAYHAAHDRGRLARRPSASTSSTRTWSSTASCSPSTARPR